MIEVSRFWRDPALPFVEARRVGDGRKVCYAAHSHESFSIGVITGGRSTYINSDQCIEVGAGTTVLMNPCSSARTTARERAPENGHPAHWP